MICFSRNGWMPVNLVMAMPPPVPVPGLEMLWLCWKNTFSGAVSEKGKVSALKTSETARTTATIDVSPVETFTLKGAIGRIVKKAMNEMPA
jgi:hypothetical protein